MFQYLINCTAIWLLSLIIFDVFLRGESYHAYNRLYLVSTFLLGVFVPLFSWDDGSVIYTSTISKPVLGVIAAKQSVVTSVDPIGGFLGRIEALLFYVYLIGVAVSLFLLAMEIIKIVQFYRRAAKTREGSCLVIETGESHGPFSLSNWIFVSDRNRYSAEEWDIIMAHEKLHWTMLHSIDVLFFQVARIVFWFHPLVYLYQRKILLLHEYQADRVCGARPKFYGQFLLEQALLQSAPALSHSFNRSPIKNRILMLTRKSSAASRFKMLVFIPVAVVCFACCSKNNFSIKKTGIVKDIKDARTVPPPSSSDVTNRSNHELEVYRTTFMGTNAYQVYFYLKENDTLRGYAATEGSDQEFDKVAYKWQDDTLASVLLFSSSSKKEFALKVWEHNRSTGMTIQDRK